MTSLPIYKVKHNYNIEREPIVPKEDIEISLLWRVSEILEEKNISLFVNVEKLLEGEYEFDTIPMENVYEFEPNFSKEEMALILTKMPELFHHFEVMLSDFFKRSVDILKTTHATSLDIIKQITFSLLEEHQVTGDITQEFLSEKIDEVIKEIYSALGEAMSDISKEKEENINPLDNLDTDFNYDDLFG